MQPESALTPSPPEPPEVVRTRSKRVSCDGGGALGHPLVWMEMGAFDTVECGYCDRRFVLAGEDGESRAADPGEANAPGVVGAETNHPSRV